MVILHFLLLSLLVAAASGCGDPDDAPSRAAQGADTAPGSSTPPAAPAVPAPPYVLQLAADLLPFDTALARTLSRLRADSGSAGADTAFLAGTTQLDEVLRATAHRFNDSLFQAAIWPDGAHGQHLQRRGAAPVGSAAAADSLRNVLLDHGIWPYRAEGDTYFAVSMPYLLSAAGPYVTEPTREYLRLAAEEQRVPTGGDAAVSIPWDSLADRLAAVDDLLQEFPDAAVRGRAEQLRTFYLRAYLTGWDNTRVFALDTRLLRPHVRSSYERFVAERGTTSTGQLVREYLSLIQQSGNRLTPAITNFQRRQFPH